MKTRPVTSRDSALPSQTTSGEIFAGLSGSKAPSVVGATSPVMSLRPAVMRVRAIGAMALTVTPMRVSSSARITVIAAMPALAAP